MERRGYFKKAAPSAILMIAGCINSSENERNGGDKDGFEEDSNSGSNKPLDSDDDGVPDSEDDFPNNPQYSRLQEDWIDTNGQNFFNR